MGNNLFLFNNGVWRLRDGIGAYTKIITPNFCVTNLPMSIYVLKSLGQNNCDIFVFDFAKHFALIDQTLKPPTNLLLKN